MPVSCEETSQTSRNITTGGKPDRAIMSGTAEVMIRIATGSGTQTVKKPLPECLLLPEGKRAHAVQNNDRITRIYSHITDVAVLSMAERVQHAG
jgi:hypothetical protein